MVVIIGVIEEIRMIEVFEIVGVIGYCGHWHHCGRRNKADRCYVTVECFTLPSNQRQIVTACIPDRTRPTNAQNRHVLKKLEK